MAEIIEFTGTVLTGPDTEQHGLWSVGGRLTFRRPAKAPDRILAGFVLPGFVDAHCHIGLGTGGPVDALTAEEQARTDLDAGSVIRHGRIGDEILALHAAGLPMASALDAACWGAREWLGAEGLEEGARADVVLCREDPRKVPEAVNGLAHVILGGRVIR